MGDDHAYPMIAFGTLKKKSAFKLLARAKNIDAQTANEITRQIDKYEKDLRHADDEDKDNINIYDYVDKKYHEYIDRSKIYQGIISDRKKAPSAYLLYNGSIRREIGLIRCKSESTKKDVVTCVADGAVAEKYKFLKNDILVVNVVDLISKLFNEIGIEHFDTSVLMEKVKNDKAVWDIYAKGLTLGVNQCEKQSTAEKCKRYKPSNISELAAFIAAIRPGFKSMYSIFESRQPFSYGVATLDNLLTTEELPIPFMLFQENVMTVLNYAGFPMSECYSIIKAIAKKHPEKVSQIKDRFCNRFFEKIKADENLSDELAQSYTQKVWQVIIDNAGYSFNSAHAYCMALDSLYCAYLKAHYPYEFYQVLLQYYSDKGNKDKVIALKKEMLEGFEIHEGEFKFGNDNRKFKADKENKVIYSSLLSLKDMNQKMSNDLYALALKKQYQSFYELLQDLTKLKSLKSNQLNILIDIDYFGDFGHSPKLKRFYQIYSELHGRSQFNKADRFPEFMNEFRDLIFDCCEKETEKQYKSFNEEKALTEIWKKIEDKPQKVIDKIKNEYKYFGYVRTTLPKLSSYYYLITEINDKYSKQTLSLFALKDARTEQYKVRKSTIENCGDLKEGNIIKIVELSEERKWKPNPDTTSRQKFIQIDEKETIIKKYLMIE